VHQHPYLVKPLLVRSPNHYPRAVQHRLEDRPSWDMMVLQDIKSLTVVYPDHQVKTLGHPQSPLRNHHTKLTHPRRALRISVLVLRYRDQLTPCGLARRFPVLFCHRCQCLSQILAS
jgi:hypothetical protein